MKAIKLLLPMLLVAGLAGCGGSSHHRHGIVAAKPLRPYASDRSALTPRMLRQGATVLAHATGTIVASNGFDPTRDGFSFENYGFIAGAELDQHAMRELFGDVVCADVPTDACTLTPAAQQWAEQVSEQMSTGHCLGFSVTALRFFKHLLSPSQFGGTTAFSLSFVPALQSEIAYGWAGQMLPDFQQAEAPHTPGELVKFLEHALPNGGAYTLGIYLPNGTGGHAITPIAVEDLGGGLYNIDVYDNNFPGVQRAMQINASNDTWSYQGGPNPNDTRELYEGHGQFNRVITEALSASVRSHPCPFCRATGTARTTGTVTVSLGGNPVEHGHILITTADGRQLGYANGRFVDQVPGARVVRPQLTQVWNALAEPIYQLPAGASMKVALDGSGANGADAAAISVTGPGFGATVGNLRPRAGTSDALSVSPGGRLVKLQQTGSPTGAAPTIRLGIDNGTGGSELFAAPRKLHGGELTLGLDQAANRVSVSTSGAPSAPVALSVTQVGPAGNHTAAGVVLSHGRRAVLSLGLAPIG
jgi:hypothetical protein